MSNAACSSLQNLLLYGVSALPTCVPAFGHSLLALGDVSIGLLQTAYVSQSAWRMLFIWNLSVLCATMLSCRCFSPVLHGGGQGRGVDLARCNKLEGASLADLGILVFLCPSWWGG
jgi:hypothetical protein